MKRNNDLANFFINTKVLILLIGLTALSYILTSLPSGVTPDPNRTCITGGWKFLLVMTHLLPFVIIPITMQVFYKTLNLLSHSLQRIFKCQLGLALIMVAIASEIGSHVTQCWYYENEFTGLNFLFYLFLIIAFALWADSLVREVTRNAQLLNVLFALSLLTASILYPLGEQANNPSYKIPLYLTLALIFAVITYRGYQLIFSWKILLVPFFSVGVNLMFIALLATLGGDPYTNPQVAYNAIFHSLHDLAGTQMGVIIFTFLMYEKGRAILSSKEN